MMVQGVIRTHHELRHLQGANDRPHPWWICKRESACLHRTEGNVANSAIMLYAVEIDLEQEAYNCKASRNSRGKSRTGWRLSKQESGR